MALHVSLNGRLVQTEITEQNTLRADEAEVLALDGLVSQSARESIQQLLLDDAFPGNTPPRPSSNVFDYCSTADTSGSAATTGATDEVLDKLQKGDCAGVTEILHSLRNLYAHEARDVRLLEDVDTTRCVLANAPVAGESSYGYHVDAEPSTLADCAFTSNYSRYFNRAKCKPRLVSAIVYTNSSWDVMHNGETLFLDDSASSGVFVCPKPGRVVLMDADISHRINAPHVDAAKPRFSVVLKLAFEPHMQPQQSPHCPSLSAPVQHLSTHVAFGSAKRLEDAAAAASASRKRMRSVSDSTEEADHNDVQSAF